MSPLSASSAISAVSLLALALLAPVALGACIAERGPSAAAPEYLRSAETEALGLPFSDAVRVGRLLFVSGQIGVLPGTLDLAPGGVEGQVRQAMENLGAILERHGSGFDRVVKCTLFLADMADWPAANRVYATFFSEHLPARSALGASGLALGGAVEIECIAAVE